MTNSLAIYDRYDQLVKAAAALQKSGYFKDVISEAQAVVKVMAGAELGLPPFASMTGIHIIQGKPALGANVIATLVNNDPRYKFRIKQCDDTACVLVWYEGGEKVGESSFTIEEAKRAELTNKDNWRKFTSDMLFARAITRGARRFASGIFGGAPIYTPDELGVEVDQEGYIDSTATDVLPDTETKLMRELGYDDALPPVVKAEPSHISNALPKVEKPAQKSKDQLEAELIEEIIRLGLSESDFSARASLAKMEKKPATRTEKLEYMRTYRGWRDIGLSPDEAAAKANANELPK